MDQVFWGEQMRTPHQSIRTRAPLHHPATAPRDFRSDGWVGGLYKAPQGLGPAAWGDWWHWGHCGGTVPGPVGTGNLGSA